MVGLHGLLGLLLFVIFAACFAYAVYWVIGKMELPQPIRTLVLVVVGLIFLIFLFENVLPKMGLGY